MNLIVTDKDKLNLAEVKKQVEGWFDTNYGLGPAQEWQYLHTEKKVLAEKYVGTVTGCPPDYKVFCFNGEPKYIQLIESRFSDDKMAYYDRDWNQMSFTSTYHEEMVSEPLNNECPKQLQNMLTLSQRLSKGFAFVRVDWYLVGDEDIYFSEMTFTPAQGIQRWTPPETDKMLGDLIELPKEKYIVT